MIELKNMCAGYEGREVLHHINLSLKPGRVTALIGPNGCGKSTLLKTIVRIHPHTSGDVLVGGKPVQDYKTGDLAKQVAYLAQGKHVPDITVLRMVLHGRFAYLNYPRKYRKEDYEIARKALEWAGLSHLENENMTRLSGGMQQKVYIAMALAQDTPAILMDEPTTYLDVSHQLRLMEMARRLADEGKTVVLVLHDLSQALRTADEVYLVHGGTVIAGGTPQDVYESGRIRDAFGVSIERIRTGTGWHYICDQL